MADEMKKTELSEEDEQLKGDLQNEVPGTAPKAKKSKGRTAGIVLAWIAGVIVILFFLANAAGYFIKSELFARLMGELFLDDLFEKMNYVTETDYEVPSDWDVDEDGIGASTNLEDLINQMQKEEEEKNKAEQEKAAQENGASSGLS